MAARKPLAKDQRFNTGFMQGNHPHMAYCREILLRNCRFTNTQRSIEYVVEGIRAGNTTRVERCHTLIETNGNEELEDLIHILVGPVLKCLYPQRFIHRPRVALGKTTIVFYDRKQFTAKIHAPFSPNHVWEMHLILGLLRYVVTLYGSEKIEHRKLVERLLAEGENVDLGRKDSCLKWIKDHEDVYMMFSTICGVRKFRVFWALLEHGERPSYLSRNRRYPTRFAYWDGVACAAIRKRLNEQGKVE